MLMSHGGEVEEGACQCSFI
ncbi:hypothetical protein SCJ4.13c [Streptomyces coelicolor A3(2)]|uniref:Uncharacterized protein n=1 Tax=Streptomyces coelicolor (strain ATCC BAA-471 / A3(2) / M145) TaxID=100226 RepID=Q9S1W0_STRCO|nr:hypothetical protein SCJ4.13c [Streptomyces coelicolor A3(2)]